MSAPSMAESVNDFSSGVANDVIAEARTRGSHRVDIDRHGPARRGATARDARWNDPVAAVARKSARAGDALPHALSVLAHALSVMRAA